MTALETAYVMDDNSEVFYYLVVPSPTISTSTAQNDVESMNERRVGWLTMDKSVGRLTVHDWCVLRQGSPPATTTRAASETTTATFSKEDSGFVAAATGMLADVETKTAGRAQAQAQAAATTASTATTATEEISTTVARPPTARPSALVEEVQDAAEAATRAADRVTIAGELEDLEFSELRSKVMLRLEEKTIASRNLEAFTAQLCQVAATINFMNETGQVMKNILSLYQYMTFVESILHRFYSAHDAQEEMVANGASVAKFYENKIRGERVLRLYGMLGMKGVLAVEIITIGSYRLDERSLRENALARNSHST
ncbi:uncharacterized protein EV154DRAFT_569028 [Mucor mucedo]|uniref:uncharacterized protein n=1 Tax=Mucor mucedo TaxID=29922 RepID=UPI00221EAC1E|nr:uncharacterized protein EV154DRAFT_569028 [Mucor mucedo]KAI7877551.1 hypothetical protein EV154DRAFT_569028 [Mucor mucedo]